MARVCTGKFHFAKVDEILIGRHTGDTWRSVLKWFSIIYECKIQDCTPALPFIGRSHYRRLFGARFKYVHAGCQYSDHCR